MRRPGLEDLVLTPKGVRFAGRVFPCAIGRGGVRRDKREGDGATPAGIHRITGLLYRADRMACPAPWARPIGSRDLWCDDPASPAYNMPVRAPFAARHERLFRPDPLYDVILTTDWNSAPPRPGAGSAIFLHIWRWPGYPTEGCIAFAREDLLWIVARIGPGTRLIVPPLPA